MIRIAIVEDEEREAKLLEEYINNYGSTHDETFQIEWFQNSIRLLDNYKPIYDIIFMDIKMPHLNGMDAAIKLRMLDSVVTLVFVTNMAKFAVKGYEVDALDFIVKPVNYSTFSMKFKKALAKVSANEGIEIVISRNGGIVCLSSRNIFYIEVTGHKLIYHLNDEIIEGYGSLTDLEEQLHVCSFMRCNSCYLINPQYISQVNGYTLTMKNGDELQISRPRKKKFMAQLADWLGEGKNIIL